MKVHVVANPTAGRGRTPRLVEDLERALAARGAATSIHFTTGPGEATRHLAGLAPGDFDRLVVVGGDGTLHEAVNARPEPLPWPVAVVPVGTANLVARDAGLALHAPLDRIVRRVLEGRPWTVDLLATDRGRALAVAGVGLDAEIVRAVARVRSGGLGGYTKWIGPIAQTFVDYRPRALEVVVDGGAPIEGGAVVVQNTYCYGGLFSLSRKATMDDGRLEVVVLRRARRSSYFRVLLRAYAGRLEGDHEVAMVSGTTVEIRASDPVSVQLDGDPAGTTPLTVRIEPRALTLLREG